MMGTIQGKNFKEEGSRPSAKAAERASAMTFLPCLTVHGFKNMASACRAAKAMPDLEVPAWKRTGVRCGLGCSWERADMLKYFPIQAHQLYILRS
jgi:hypothetical protein